MNKIFKRTTGIAAALLLTVATVATALTGSTSAIPYTPGATGTDHPSFNNFTGVPGYGDEHDFVTGRVSGSSAAFADPVNDPCTDGRQYSVRVYIHNNANQTLNNGGNGPGVAHNTKVRVALPSTTNGKITGTISASNASTVSDNLTIHCTNGKTMTMSYVAGSAIQQKINGATAPLSDSIVTTGAPIGTQSPNGDMWGCFEQRVLVYLKVQVKETPPPPPVVNTSCDLFRITASSDRKVTVSQFKYTAKNTSFKNAVINWGDNSSDSYTDSSKVVGSMHQYASTGTYTLRATVNFANGDSKTSANCVQRVTFTPNQPPEIIVPPTTTTEVTPSETEAPSELVNTGPGETAAMFAIVSAIGTLGYRFVLSRRLG